jgi:hypothetical protein
MFEARQALSVTPKLKLLFKIVLVVAVLLLLNYGGSRVVEHINFQLWPEHEHLMITVVWFTIAVYVLWMAVPFVPGIELGLALMVMLGSKGVVLVYFCTLLSLSLSFAVGRLIPLKAFARFLGWLHLRKAHDLVVQLKPLDSEERLDFLLRTAPSKIVPYLLKHRYLMIAEPGWIADRATTAGKVPAMLPPLSAEMSTGIMRNIKFETQSSQRTKKITGLFNFV